MDPNETHIQLIAWATATVKDETTEQWHRDAAERYIALSKWLSQGVGSCPPTGSSYPHIHSDATTTVKGAQNEQALGNRSRVRGHGQGPGHGRRPDPHC